MGLIDNFAKRFLEKGTIVSKLKISDSVYHIRIHSENVKSVDFVPGYFIRLGVGFEDDNISLKDKVRSYSVWNINKSDATIDVAIATHSNGIGSNWVKKCAVGMEVFFAWKKGTFVLDNSADSYLMIGDLSALSHLYIINRSLTEEKQVESIVYTGCKEDFFADVEGKFPFDFYEFPQNPYSQIIAMIPEVVAKMKGKKMVYIAGDSRLCVALNQYFRKELNWESNQIKTKPFWNPEKKGLE
jgi:NADPH-dependent ferric siderophore reductase